MIVPESSVNVHHLTAIGLSCLFFILHRPPSNMSNTYTPNIKLAMPAIGDTGWSIPVNANCTALDGFIAVGALAVTTTEVPSASTNVAVAPGPYIHQDGTIGTYPGPARWH